MKSVQMQTLSLQIAVRIPLVALIAVLAIGCGRDKSPDVTTEKRVPPPIDAPKAEPAIDEAAAPLGLLISAEDLKKRLADKNLRIIDVRPVAGYLKSHIPGAVPVNVAQWKQQGFAEEGFHDSEAWSSLLRPLGIDRESTNVVVYADNPTNATRIWWTLKYLGVEHAAILDGGWQHWQTAGGETSDLASEVTPVDFAPWFQPQMLAEIDDLKESVKAATVTIIDTRSADEFTGAGGPGIRKGRIPGAKHIEWKELLGEDGRFKSKAELKKLFADRGVSNDKPAVTYCQTGGRASLDAFALQLAGYTNVKNYYCSWSQWSADEKAPVEKD